MAVITIGTSGATWGLTAETGILVQTSTGKSSRDKNEVRDEQGDIALVAYYNPLRKGTSQGVIIGTGGVVAAAPGVTLTVANLDSGNGITATSGVYTDDVEIKRGNTEFKSITVNWTQYKFA